MLPPCVRSMLGVPPITFENMKALEIVVFASSWDWIARILRARKQV